MTRDEFFHSTPRLLKAHMKAYELKLKRIDGMAWQICGNYVMSAVAVAVEHCLAGRKARSKYVESPVLRTAKIKKDDPSKTDVQKQIDLFVAKLETMKANFDANKRNA